jgi:hypothetical protein
MERGRNKGDCEVRNGGGGLVGGWTGYDGIVNMIVSVILYKNSWTDISAGWRGVHTSRTVI